MENGNIEPNSNPILKTALFLEERLFLNKSQTKWLTIGAQPMPGGEFIAVVRLCESESKYVTFTRNEIPHLYSVLEYEKSSFGCEFEENHKWWKDILFLNKPQESSPIHFKIRDHHDDPIYEIGNKTHQTFPFYIMIGQNTIQALYEHNKLIWKMVNEVKTNFCRVNLSELINTAIAVKDVSSEHMIYKQFLEKEATRFCGSNAKHSTIARDALTHGFEYFKLIAQRKAEKQLSTSFD